MRSPHWSLQAVPKLASALLVIGLLPMVGLAGTTSGATSKNANLDGTWSIYQGAKSLDADFAITGENVDAGTFSGRVNLPPSAAKFGYYDITDGEVLGNSFTIKADYPGTVVNENGVEITYSGTVDGSTMSGRESDFEAWRHGHKVDASAVGDQSFTAKREVFELSGTVTYGCAPTVPCTSAPGPLPNAEVDVDGPVSDSDTTDSDGKWTLNVPAGHYTITPVEEGITFSPASIDVDVTKAESGQDFEGCGAQSVDNANDLAPRIGANVKSATWSLGGTDCWNTFSISYFTASKSASLSWSVPAYYCNPEGKWYPDPAYRRDLFSYKMVNTNSTDGGVFVEPNGNVKVHADFDNTIVIEFTLFKGGASGRVKTTVSPYDTTDSKDNICAPKEVQHFRLPFPPPKAST